MSLQTLVLNADYRPLSMNPLSAWHWKGAVAAIILDRVTLVAEYDAIVRSPSLSMRVPSVVALKSYQSVKGNAAFTRYNIYCRDRWTCQYCNRRFPSEELTFDHVHPRSRGGRSSWENIVAACSPCNFRKANRTPQEAGMALRRQPYVPTRRELATARPRQVQSAFHHTWLDFLYWESELEA